MWKHRGAVIGGAMLLGTGLIACNSQPLGIDPDAAQQVDQPADLLNRREFDDEFVRYPPTEVIRFPSEGIELEGILDLPGFQGRYPLMVFVHGAGIISRTYYQSFTDIYRPIGYATFRYDKRGVGASGGAYRGINPANSEIQLGLLGADANAAVQALKMHPRIDSNQIILIGGSQAGLIIPLAATLSDNVAYCVIMVGPMVTIGLQYYYSSISNRGWSDSTVAALLSDWNGLHGYDPAPFVEQMNMPSIWLLGGRDRSVPTIASIDILDEIIARDSKPFTIDLYPTGTHSLRDEITNKVLPFYASINNWLWQNRQGISDQLSVSE